MKILNILFILAFAVTTALGQTSDPIETFFNKYQDDNRFMMVEISPKMFEMFAKVAPEDLDQEVRDMISGLKGLKILKSETEEGVEEFYNEAIKTINLNAYEELMTVRGDNEHVKFMVKDSDNGDIVNELLLLVGGEEFVMMSFVGDINLKTISKMAQNINIDGMEHLKGLEKHEKRKKEKH